jgi:hypothetical protein
MVMIDIVVILFSIEGRDMGDKNNSYQLTQLKIQPTKCFFTNIILILQIFLKF